MVKLSKAQVNRSHSIETGKGVGDLDSKLFYSLLILMALLPLVFTTITADQFGLPKFVTLQFGMLLLIGWWTIALIASSKLEIKRTDIDILIGLFFISIIISTLFSLNFPTSFFGKYYRHEGLLTIAWYLSLFYLSAQIFDSINRIYLHMKIMVVIAAIISVYGLLQYLGIDFFHWAVPNGVVAGQSMSTFGNRSFLAGFLDMTLPIAFVCFFLQVEWKKSFIFGFFFLLIAACLVTTFSRGAWIGALAGFLFFLVLTRRSLFLKRQQVFLLGIFFLLILILLAIFGFQLSSEVKSLVKRATSILRPTTGSTAVRVEIWKSTMKIITARPVIGSGRLRNLNRLSG